MHKLKKKILNNQIFFLLFISTWLCIDTNFENILALKKNFDIRNLYLSLRAILPVFLIVILFIIILLKKKFQFRFYTNNKNFNIVLILISSIFLIQLYGLISTKNSIFNSYYILVSLIAVFFTLASYTRNLEKISYIICLSFLATIISVYSFLNYRWLLTTGNLQLYGTFPHVYWSLEIFSNNVIRSSGLSRSSLIFLFPIFFILLINHRTKLIYLLIYSILVANIYLAQSRTILLFYVPFVIFAIFYYLRNENIKYILKKFFILFIFPIIFFNSFLIIKEEFRTKEYSKKFVLSLSSKINVPNSLIQFAEKDNIYWAEKKLEELQCTEIIDGVIESTREEMLECNTINAHKEGFYIAPRTRTVDPSTFSSNRLKYWKNVVASSKNPILGYGALGDRFLIDQNSHNLIVYTYASGGLICSFIIIILLLRYIYLCIYLTFIKKIKLESKNILILSSIFTVSFLIFRGLTQVSIGVFSIDFLVFLTCISICEKFAKKNQL